MFFLREEIMEKIFTIYIIFFNIWFFSKNFEFSRVDINLNLLMNF